RAEPREGKDTGGLNDLGQTERGLVEAGAQRVTDRLDPQRADAPGDDRGRVLRPRVVDDEVLVAIDSMVRVEGDVPDQIGRIAGPPVHAVASSEPLLRRDVVIDLDVDLVVYRFVDSLREEIVDVREGVPGRGRRRVVLEKPQRDRVLHRGGNDVPRERVP